VRNALSHWLARGGVGVAFLGPKAATAELGATLEPFAQHAVRWELTGQTSVDAASLGWLGNESESLTDLGNKSRTRFDPAELQDARQLARFADREPFLLERAPGHGLLLTFALPTSVSQSDFALRPAFLALLDHALTEARTRTGARRTLVGTPWSFPATSSVEITGPDGQRHKLEPARSVGSQSDQQLRFVPELHGRYALSVDGERQERIVTLDPSEIQSAARAPQSGASAASKGSERAQVNASPELALGVLALFLVELAYRAIRRTLSARRGHASQVFERSRP
jgi:hypothetical protein